MTTLCTLLQCFINAHKGIRSIQRGWGEYNLQTTIRTPIPEIILEICLIIKTSEGEEYMDETKPWNNK